VLENDPRCIAHPFVVTSEHVVQAHGGRLGIESALGRGTTVRVTLPAVQPGGSPTSV
jgi:light-regulated signal transduction histidine kinase (bacteriophytochrome)